MKTAFFMMFALATGAVVPAQAHAQGLDKLKGMMGGGSSSSLSSASTGNAAGVIQFCLKNNYLGSDGGAATVKDKLLGKLGGDTKAASNDATSSAGGGLMGKLGGGATTPTKDPGYLSGASGILQTGNGKKVDLSSLGGGGSSGGMKEQLTRKVCDQVLKQGKSMVGM
jgi:Protein of unknown function (DUF2501)